MTRVALTAGRPRRSLVRRFRGFTFIEVLAAMLFMAIVVPVAIEGIMLANTVGQRSTRMRAAAELADRLLTESLVTESWRDGDQSGVNESGTNRFDWQLSSASWDEDTMRVVAVEVSYEVQGRRFVERLSTLASETEEEPAADAG